MLFAALSVKVIARMRSGSTPLSTRRSKCATRTVVLPEPGPADAYDLNLVPGLESLVPNAAVAGCLLTWTSRRSRHCQDWLAWGFREDLCVFPAGFASSLWPQPCWLGRWCWYPGLCRRPRVAE